LGYRKIINRAKNSVFYDFLLKKVLSVSKNEIYRGESAFLTISIVSNQKNDTLPNIKEIAGSVVLVDFTIHPNSV